MLSEGKFPAKFVEEELEEGTDIEGRTVTTISEDESGDRSSLFKDLGLISILVVLVEKLDFGELSSELGVSMSLSSSIAISLDFDWRFAIC